MLIAEKSSTNQIPYLCHFYVTFYIIQWKFFRVFFIASTPGTHSKKTPVNWGLTRLAELLKQNAIIPTENAKDWPLYYQCSSIGSLGKDPHAWLLGEVTRVMSSAKKCLSFQPPAKLVRIEFFIRIFQRYG